MSLLMQIAIVFGITLLGEGIAVLLPLPIPGNIIAMLLLLLFLGIKWIKPEQIQTFSQFLLKNMAFLFIPAGVSIMESMDLLSAQLIEVMVVCILSTIITFGVTGFTAQWVIKIQEKKRGLKNGEHH